MERPGWSTMVLGDGILREPTGQDNRLVLWLPGKRTGAQADWLRVATVARADVKVEDGISTVPATSICARPRNLGLLGRLLQPFFAKAGSEQTWVLPNGVSAEQTGERRTDLLLAWSADEARPVDERCVRQRWPQCQEVHALGPNLWLVTGVLARPDGAALGPLPPQGEPLAVAEQLLTAARQAGDRAREIAALTDLGAVYRRAGDSPRSLAVLEEALALARQLGDAAPQCDALGNLGLTVLGAGQAQRALDLFTEELSIARQTQNVLAEKSALEHVGLTYSALRIPAQALPSYQSALALARQLGDRQHEADLLWYIAIQHADLGQRDEVLHHGEAAIALYQKMGHPHTDWFADHLRRFQSGEANVPAGDSLPPTALGSGGFQGGEIIASGWAGTAAPFTATRSLETGPGLLRMAISAAKSMTKFVGSGFQTVPETTFQQRLRTCGACEHHTGLRCRVCGCFTAVKTRLPHEACPIGKW
jgi:tetratricopeptide (TPR) repeat protein